MKSRVKYIPDTRGQASGSVYESVANKILGARSESAILLNAFGMTNRLAVGLTNSQQRSLILTAAWRWARANTRRLAGDPNTSCVIACGHDLAVIYKRFPGISRLDFERIAVDALHSLPPTAFKRRRSAHGCRRR